MNRNSVDAQGDSQSMGEEGHANQDGMRQVPIDSLTLPQLLELKQQFDNEVQGKMDMKSALQQAKVRYENCRKALTALDNTEGQEMLVPLSDSLYVNGRQGDTDKILVDIGTNYFVEKSRASAIKYSERKTEMLGQKIVEVEKQLEANAKVCESFETVMRRKVAEHQQMQQDKNPKGSL